MTGEMNSQQFEISNRRETSSVHMTFHFGFISKRRDLLMDMRKILLAPYLFTNIAALFSRLKESEVTKCSERD